MRRSFGLACLVLLSAPLAHADELTDFTARIKPSVVFLESLSSSGEVIASGTGFFISADGKVATNEHVATMPGESMRATLSNGKVVQVLGSLALDHDHDVAILQLAPGTYPPLPLATKDSVSDGEHVVVVGNPLGLSFTVSDGVVANAHRELPEDLRMPDRKLGQLIQITAPITHGSSGSPVLSPEGKVIGIAESSVEDVSNIGFAVPVERLLELSAKVKPGARPMPLYVKEVKSDLRNWLISGAFYGLLALAIGGAVLRQRLQRKRIAASVRWPTA